MAGSRSIAVQDGPGDVIALVEEDIPANYEAPLTVGAGVGYDWSRTSLNAPAKATLNELDSTLTKATYQHRRPKNNTLQRNRLSRCQRLRPFPVVPPT